jgi:hypothetical protein
MPWVSITLLFVAVLGCTSSEPPRVDGAATSKQDAAVGGRAAGMGGGGAAGGGGATEPQDASATNRDAAVRDSGPSHDADGAGPTSWNEQQSCLLASMTELVAFVGVYEVQGATEQFGGCDGGGARPAQLDFRFFQLLILGSGDQVRLVRSECSSPDSCTNAPTPGSWTFRYKTDRGLRSEASNGVSRDGDRCKVMLGEFELASRDEGIVVTYVNLEGTLSPTLPCSARAQLECSVDVSLCTKRVEISAKRVR